MLPNAVEAVAVVKVSKWEGSIIGAIPKGPTYSFYGSAEAHDGSGNHAEISVTQHSDGSGSASVSGGHQSDSK